MSETIGVRVPPGINANDVLTWDGSKWTSAAAAAGGGAPSGAAAGDLSGTYPNPGVAKIGGVAVTVDTDGTLAANSDAKLATQKAVKTYTDAEATARIAAAALKAPLASPTFTGIVTAPEFSASGLTGATAASRYVGATTAGAPTSGTFAVGDFVLDQAGAIYECISAGSPGTWLMATLPIYNSGALLGETGAPETLSQAVTPVITSGRIYDSRLIVRQSAASGTRTIWYYVNTVGATLTAGQNLIAVYNSAGVKLGSTSADLTTPFGASTGILSTTVGTFAVNAGDVLHVELLSVGTTPPKMGGLTANQTGAANANIATPSATLRASVQASGQTAMPASITPGSLAAANAVLMYFGIS